jgi:hypothetical protein
MASYTQVLGRFGAVLAIVVAAALLCSRNPITAAQEETMTTNEEYLVLGTNRPTPEPMFYSATALQEILNRYARQGWKVRAAATIDNSYVILARPASNR